MGRKGLLREGTCWAGNTFASLREAGSLLVSEGWTIGMECEGGGMEAGGS